MSNPIASIVCNRNFYSTILLFKSPISKKDVIDLIFHTIVSCNKSSLFNIYLIGKKVDWSILTIFINTNWNQSCIALGYIFYPTLSRVIGLQFNRLYCIYSLCKNAINPWITLQKNYFFCMLFYNMIKYFGLKMS